MSVTAILAIVRGTLALANMLVGFLDTKQKMDAGMAKAFLQTIKQGNQIINDAQKSIRYVRDNPNSEYARKLREKYTKR